MQSEPVKVHTLPGDGGVAEGLPGQCHGTLSELTEGGDGQPVELVDRAFLAMALRWIDSRTSSR